MGVVYTCWGLFGVVCVCVYVAYINSGVVAWEWRVFVYGVPSFGRTTSMVSIVCANNL